MLAVTDYAVSTSVMVVVAASTSSNPRCLTMCFCTDAIARHIEITGILFEIRHTIRVSEERGSHTSRRRPLMLMFPMRRDPAGHDQKSTDMLSCPPVAAP